MLIGNYDGANIDLYTLNEPPLISDKPLSDVENGSVVDLLGLNQQAKRRSLPHPIHFSPAHRHNDGDGERVHRQRQARTRIILEDILEHLLLPRAVLRQRLPPVGPPHLVGLGETVLEEVLGEVLGDVGARAAPVAGMVGDLLAEELLDGGVEGGVAGVADGRPDVLRRLEAAREWGGVEG